MATLHTRSLLVGLAALLGAAAAQAGEPPLAAGSHIRSFNLTVLRGGADDRVENVTNTHLAVVDGAPSTFEEGTVQQYVSAITSHTNTADGTTTTEVETGTLHLGTQATLSAAPLPKDGGAQVSLSLSLSQLLSLDNFSAGLGTIQLPHVAENSWQWNAALRPGETTVLYTPKATDGGPMPGASIQSGAVALPTLHDGDRAVILSYERDLTVAAAEPTTAPQ